MNIEEKLHNLLSKVVDFEGFELILVRFHGAQKYRALEVMVDHKSGEPVNLGECEKLSHQISAILDVEDVVPGAYNLEITSPGSDRPLTRPEHFKKFVGKNIKINLKSPINDRKKFKGKLLEATETFFKLELVEESKKEEQNQILEIEYENIQTAKLFSSEEDFREILRAKNQEKRSKKKRNKTNFNTQPE